MPRFDPRRKLGRSSPRRPRLHLVAAPDAYVSAPLATPRPAVWLPLDGASAAERARRLRAAHAASDRDTGQRELIEEIMGHFRAWCEANALGDPFRTA